MATDQADSFHAFAGKMFAAAATTKAAGPRAVQAGALVITTGVRTEIGRLTRGGILRGVGKTGAKVGARFVSTGKDAVVLATGPLWLLERDNRPHVMPAPGKQHAGPYRTPQGPRARIVKHPGSKGKHPFAKGVEVSLPAADRAMAAVMTEATLTALR